MDLRGPLPPRWTMRTRLFGVFSGTQLTVIATALLLALSVPATTFAAHASKVAIANAKGAAKVKKGRLQVDAAIGSPITGAVTVTNPVTVSGTLSTRPAAPADLFRSANINVGNSCQVVTTVPAGKALILVSLTVDVPTAPASGSFVGVFANGNCTATPAADLAIVSPVGLGPVDLTFGAGVLIPAGSSVSTVTVGSLTAHVLTYGYYVNAG